MNPVDNNDSLSFLGSFRTRSFRVGGYSVAASAIVLAMAILINVIVGALPSSMTQIDVSFSQRFSISEQTEKIVKGLEKEVTVYWVVQDGMEDATIKQLLDKYKGMNKKVRVEKKDPDLYPTFVFQYTDAVNNNSLIVVSEDRYRYVDYYEIYEYEYTYSSQAGDYVLTDLRFAGEGALTSAIDYVVSDKIPKIYLLSGHGELALSSTFATALSKENVETATLSLLTQEGVPEDADAVMIYAPQRDISADERDKLLAYLQKGGKMFLMNGPLDNLALTNLEAVLAYYGVEANPGLVVEADSNSFMYGMPFYLLPTMGSHVISAPLNGGGYRVMLPIAQGLTVQKNIRESVVVEKLMTTSASSFSKLASYSLTTYEKEPGDIDGPFAVAVAISESVGEESTQIVWVSSEMLLDEDANSWASGANLDFFLNSVNWMCEQDENTISIRGKSLDGGYLTIDDATVTQLTVMMVAVIPVVYLCVGIFVWVRRRRR